MNTIVTVGLIAGAAVMGYAGWLGLDAARFAGKDGFGATAHGKAFVALPFVLAGIMLLAAMR